MNYKFSIRDKRTNKQLKTIEELEKAVYPNLSINKETGIFLVQTDDYEIKLEN